MNKKYYFSLSMNFKNEEDYIKEWIEYHLAVGVEHFYLFDNASSDKSIEKIAPFKNKGLVTLHSSDKMPIKPISYQYTLESYSKDNRWIGFLDCDEFLNPQAVNDIKVVLQDYEKYPALGVNWKLFGDCGFEKKPNGYTTKNFIKRQDEKKGTFNSCYHIKSIIDPSKTIPRFINPHYFLYDPIKSFPKVPAAVNEKYETIDGKNHEDKEPNGIAFSPSVNYERLSVHHYWCRSKEEYYFRKCSKPRDDNNVDRNLTADKEYIEYNEKSNEIVDTSIIRHLDRISSNE